jgi:DNA-binding NarL/FixJ family response regulator
MTDAARSPISVLLVDDHAVVREGYIRLLERHGEIVVIGEAGDAATAHSLFCSGYVTKASAPNVLVQAIHAIASG